MAVIGKKCGNASTGTSIGGYRGDVWTVDVIQAVVIDVTHSAVAAIEEEHAHVPSFCEKANENLGTA